MGSASSAQQQSAPPSRPSSSANHSLTSSRPQSAGQPFASYHTSLTDKPRLSSASVLGERVSLNAGDADPRTLEVLQYVRAADDHEGQFHAQLKLLQAAEEALDTVIADDVDGLSVLVYQRLGTVYRDLGQVAQAKDALGKAIRIAEVMVAERRPFLYLVLVRYVDAVLHIAQLWLEEEGKKAQEELDRNRRKSTGLVTSLTPAARRNMRAASETALLRCVETVELGDHKQSEILLTPLIELAKVYEAVEVFNRAILVLRRCIGILCVVYAHDHIRIPELQAWIARLTSLRRVQMRTEAAIKIQSVIRMFFCLRMLETVLNRRVKRHRWTPKHLRQGTVQRNEGFLTTYFGATDVSFDHAGTVGAGGSHSPAATNLTSSSEPRVEPSLTPTQIPNNSDNTTVHVHHHHHQHITVHHDDTLPPPPAPAADVSSPVVPTTRKVKVVRPASPVLEVDPTPPPPPTITVHHHHHQQQPPQVEITSTEAAPQALHHNDDEQMIIRVVQGPMGQSIMRHEERHHVTLAHSDEPEQRVAVSVQAVETLSPAAAETLNHHTTTTTTVVEEPIVIRTILKKSMASPTGPAADSSARKNRTRSWAAFE